MPAGVCIILRAQRAVARLAETLGLPGPSSAAVDTARDKHSTRAAMKASTAAGCYRVNDETIPKSGVCGRLPCGAQAAERRRVTRCESRFRAELRCYADVLAEMRATVASRCS